MELPPSNVKNLARFFEHSSSTSPDTICLRRQLHFLKPSIRRLRSRSLSPPRRLPDGDGVVLTHHSYTTSELVTPVSRVSEPSKPHPQCAPRVCVEEEGGSGRDGGESKEVGALKADSCEMKKMLASLKEELKQREQGLKLLSKKLEESGTSRAGRGSLKQWEKWQPSNISDVLRKLPRHDVVVDPEEIVHLFIEAEKIYVDSLHALEFFYHEPLNTLSAFKPDVLSYSQLGALFLNSSELLVVHRFLLQDLSHIPSLPRSIQVDELLTTLERFFPSLPLYGPHLASARHQSLQKEYRTCLQRPQFKQLLEHCQGKCGGRGLLDFLNLPSERLSDYVSLLSHFLGAHMRNLSDAAVKRAEILVNYLNKLKYGLQEQHSEWERAQEKAKVLHKLDPEAPVPMEMFEADVELVKQGPLTMVKGNREIPCTGLLFKTYFAITDRPNGSGDGVHLRVLEYGMIPLSSAQLHKCVDVEGQTMQPDLQSGLSEDRMGFRISFKNNESLFFRVAKPNERKAWVEALERCIHDAHPANHSRDDTVSVTFSPEVGPKIAAASLEKLFQQLLSPHMFRDDFVEVFLMTHSCFTSSMDVLTALINCINSPTDHDTSSESRTTSTESAIFTFSEATNVTTSITDISMAFHIMCTSESENESPSASPSFARRPLPPATVHNLKGEVVGVPAGRGVASTTSTSDSDVSPHTSAIVVDNGTRHDASTQNGWQPSEVFIRGEEHSLYVTLCPPDYRKMSHSSDHSWGDAEDSDGEEEERGTRGEGGAGGEDNLPTPCNSVHKEMDSTKPLKQLEDVREDVEFLSLGPSSRGHVYARGKSAETELDGDRSMSPSNRLSTQNSAALCTSEPNLVTMGTHHTPLSSSPAHPTPPKRDVGGVGVTTSTTTTPPLSRSQPFHHGMAMTAPAGALMKEFASAKKGLRKSASLEKRSNRHAGELTVSLGGHALPLAVVSSGIVPSAQANDSATTATKKSHKGFKGIFSRLNKMRGKKEGKSLDDVVPSGETKARRNSTLKRRPTHSGGLTASLGGSLGAQPIEPPFHSSTSRSGSMSAGSGATQYSTLVSKIFSILHCWQDLHYEDFERDEELKSMLYDFLDAIVNKNIGNDSPVSRQALYLTDLIKVKEPTTKDGTLPSLLQRVTYLNPSEVAMYSWSALDKLRPLNPLDLSKAAMREGPACRAMAQQLTLMEFAVYKAVQRFELLNCNWKKADKERLAPNVCRLIRRTNELTSWVCTEVLSQDSPHARANVIELFIDIAKHCYSHNDFHCSLNITIALKSSAVRGLTKTWTFVDKKSRHRLERLSKLTDYNGRCKKLRETLEQLTEDSLEKNETLPSALPYLGAYLDQIYTLEMSTKTFNPDRLVNFTKMTKLSDLVRTALQYQESNFAFEPQLDMMAYIMSAKRLSENELYDLSMKLEPRS